MSDTFIENPTEESKPLFPKKAIGGWRQLNLGLNLSEFAGGSERLTRRTYRAYIGFLAAFAIIWSILSFLVGIMAFMGLPEVVWIFIGMVWFCGAVLITVNGIRAIVYRFHDLDLHGWWLLGLVVIAFVIDSLLVATLNPTGFAFKISGGLFLALLYLAPFILKGEKSENKFGPRVDYNWKSFPGEVRFFGHFAFAMSILSVLMSGFAFIMAALA